MFNVNTIGHTTHIRQSNSCQTRPGIALLMVATSYVIRPFLLAGHKHLSAMNLPCHLTMDFLSSSFFSYFFFFCEMHVEEVSITKFLQMQAHRMLFFLISL